MGRVLLLSPSEALLGALPKTEEKRRRRVHHHNQGWGKEKFGASFHFKGHTRERGGGERLNCAQAAALN